MNYSEGYLLYFPDGFHDAYFNKIEIDFHAGNVVLFLDSIALDYKEVALRFIGVTSFDLKNIFANLSQSDEISSLEIDGNSVTVTGIKGWVLTMNYASCDWVGE